MRKKELRERYNYYECIRRKRERERHLMYKVSVYMYILCVVQGLMDQQPLLVLSSGFTDKHSNHDNQLSSKRGQSWHKQGQTDHKTDRPLVVFSAAFCS